MADNARRMLDFHIERATESLVEAGAYKIEVDRLMRYSGWHLLGTARMGDDPATSVVDRWNRAHDVPNVYVVDGILLRDVVGGEPDLDDRRHRSPGGGPHDRDAVQPAGSGMITTELDPIASLDAEARAIFAEVADHLIPAAGAMPSAAEVATEDRLRFVLRARLDLLDPLRAALRPDLGSDVAARLVALATEPATLAALQLAIVAAYYTDKRVRELIGYPGQMAIELKSWLVPAYLEEGLIDAVLARGPAWRDPRTGRRAVLPNQPRTYAERFQVTSDAEGDDGRDRA